MGICLERMKEHLVKTARFNARYIGLRGKTNEVDSKKRALNIRWVSVEHGREVCISA